MSEESTTKKEWKKPEIVDLDLDKTQKDPGLVENAVTSFS